MMSPSQVEFLSGLAKPARLFAVPLAITVVASMFISPGIRSVRNLGIAACYVAMIYGLTRLGWRQTLLVWTALGLLSGLLYFACDCFSYSRSNDPSATRPPLSTIPYGVLAWPIMAPEAVEYFLADIGVFRAFTRQATEQGLAAERPTQSNGEGSQ